MTNELCNFVEFVTDTKNKFVNEFLIYVKMQNKLRFKEFSKNGYI